MERVTYFPRYIKQYPNMETDFPLHLSVNRIERGFPAHRHDFLEFSFVLEGEGTEAINGKVHPMRPGTFTFVLPYQVHEIFTAPGRPLVLYNCMFGINCLLDSRGETGLAGLISEPGEELPSFVHFEEEEQTRIRQLIDEMFREYRGDELWRSALLRSRLAELLIRFDRLRQERRLRARPAASRQRPPGALPAGRTIWHVVNHIHSHYSDELTLSALAEQFCYSPSYLSELIKNTTGQTFVRFLHDLRIRHACGLLASTDMSVSEIALEVGYGSYKTFARMFRETKGVTPREYRLAKQRRHE